MPIRYIQVGKIEKSEDWYGNNAAFVCPMPECGKVYIVSAIVDKDGRECPSCKQSKAFVTGSQSKNGEAHIEWNSN
jgi:hypothetical protein